ncbi:hypothetical protein EKK58_10500 [Candidatus Dependentiae bacterium]|nr:MAG: hypothetical protein EKK58_10500 [Candidatus Dependentiae bacterium]
MSSVHVRSSFKTFLATNVPSETVIDLTAQFDDIRDLLDEAGIGMGDAWLGIDFQADDEIPISIAAGNNQGVYRESGVVQIHIVDVAKLGIGDSLLARAEVLRDLLRGIRINDIRIESVTPPSFAQGTTLEFESGFMSCTIMISYEYDKNL